MGFKCGIVGLPNVGKSTLFNALTQSLAAESANYAFCTIEPNVGVVEVADPRLTQIAELVQPRKVIPASLEFVDIAGLVAGASKGEGLGNQFLAHIREVDAVAHVVRAFDEPEITHVPGVVDPRADAETIQTELLLADLATTEKALQRATSMSQSGNKQAVALRDLLQRVQAHLNDAQPLRALKLTDEQRADLKSYCFLTAKPTLYIANISENGLKDNPHLDALTQYADAENADVLAICASLEQELTELSRADAQQFLAELGWQESGLARLTRAGYALLGLQTFFTAGPKEVRAWTIPQGSRAPQAAGVIHSDFEKGFIRAETIGFDDYIRYHGEVGAKQAGRMRAEGKDYVVADGDVILFRFNV